MDFDYSNGELTVSKCSWQLVATKTTTVCTGDKLGAIAWLNNIRYVRYNYALTYEFYDLLHCAAITLIKSLVVQNLSPERAIELYLLAHPCEKPLSSSKMKVLVWLYQKKGADYIDAVNHDHVGMKRGDKYKKYTCESGMFFSECGKISREYEGTTKFLYMREAQFRYEHGKLVRVVLSNCKWLGGRSMVLTLTRDDVSVTCDRGSYYLLPTKQDNYRFAPEDSWRLMHAVMFGLQHEPDFKRHLRTMESVKQLLPQPIAE